MPPKERSHLKKEINTINVAKDALTTEIFKLFQKFNFELRDQIGKT